MLIVTAEKRISRHAAYRARKGDEYREKNATRMRHARSVAIPRFYGVDSEGIGRGRNHRTVLLGIGEESYICKDLRKGLQWDEVLEFLYGAFERDPKGVYAGFFLGYDFNRWLATLPRKQAWLLFSKAGIAMRRIREQKGRRTHHPVRLDGWEFDMLGMRRLSLRPQACTCAQDGIKGCGHPQKPWMHVCDAGSFFQMSLLNVIDPAKWADDPGGPVCTQAEYDKIKEGKDSRGVQYRITQKMTEYNTLENIVLARVMDRLARGFRDVGIRLGRDQWYGPGATSKKWLQANGGLHREKLAVIIPDWFLDACRKSYFGGWFEIFSHGIIYGKSWNYDINNAYPYAAHKLPHLCDECSFRRGKGTYEGGRAHVLVCCTVFSASDRIGAMPYRDKNGSILRPSVTKGWYWRHELDASRRAGLVKRVIEHEWMEFTPCEHPKPFTDISRLYDLRLQVGKNSAQGMAIKLNNNSIYGNFAQMVGAAPYNNFFYASFITSWCRTMILDAIATHPGGPESVLMVATDGICFDSPHPGLPLSKKLGEWEETEYTDLCLFKPGVYWHREGKEALLKVKSRGVPKAQFAEAIEAMELQFALMHREGKFPGDAIVREAFNLGVDIAELRGEKGWPKFRIYVNFRMKSCKQALNEGEWDRAGSVQEKFPVLQDSDPSNKRRRPVYNMARRRIDTSIHFGDINNPETYYHGDVKRPKQVDIGYGYDGNPLDGILEGHAILRDKPANYDLPLNEIEWETVWEGTR